MADMKKQYLYSNCVKLSKAAKEIYDMLKPALGDEIPNHWILWSLYSSPATAKWGINLTYGKIHFNRRIIIHEDAAKLKVILTLSVEVRRVLAKFIPPVIMLSHSALSVKEWFVKHVTLWPHSPVCQIWHQVTFSFFPKLKKHHTRKENSGRARDQSVISE